MEDDDTEKYKSVILGKKTFGELISKYESNQKPTKANTKKVKGDLKTIIKYNYPKITDLQYQKFIELREKTENDIRQTIKTKSNTGYLKSLVSKAKTRFAMIDLI